MALYELDGMAPELPSDFSFVAENATVIGKVRIGSDVGIWFNAVLRGDNEMIDVGARTNIQENAVLHTDMGFPLTIGEGCTIGHKAMLHGCTIGENSLVGMGATILNGAVIGKNCLIGAGALVTEGKEIPDCSLVMGSPAKIIRTLSEEQQARLVMSAEIYVKNFKRFKAEMQADQKN